MDVSKEYDALLGLRKKGLIPYYGFFSSSICLLYLRKLKQARLFEDSSFAEMIRKRTYDRAILREKLLQRESDGLEANSLTCMLPDFASLLSKKNEIWNYLDEDLPYYKGEEMASLIQKLLEYADKDFSKGRNHASQLDLIAPIRKVLDVKKEETFLDIFAGFYTLGYGIEAKSYYGFDKEQKALGVACMAMSLLGKEGNKLKKADVYSLKDLPRCDKIFLDASFLGAGESKKSEGLIRLALHSLNPGGEAVVLCDSKLLNGEEFLSFRKELSVGGHLSSVVSLPGKAASRLYLLLLSEKENTTVEFLDASHSKTPLKPMEEEKEKAPRSASCPWNGFSFLSSSKNLGFLAMPVSSDKRKEEGLPLKKRLEKVGCLNLTFKTLRNEDVQSEKNVALSPFLYCGNSGEEEASSESRNLRDIEADLDKEYRKFLDLCSFHY